MCNIKLIKRLFRNRPLFVFDSNLTFPILVFSGEINKREIDVSKGNAQLKPRLGGLALFDSS